MSMKSVVLVLTAAVAGMASALTEAEKAFDEAWAAGKPLSAESAYKKLVKENPNTAPIRYYQAAEVAAQLGKGSLRMDRYKYFLARETGWSPEVEQALWYVAMHGGKANLFLRLAERVPHDAILFDAGLQNMRGLRDGNDLDGFTDIALALLSWYPAPGRVNSVCWEMSECARNNKNADWAKLLAALMDRDIRRGAFGSFRYHRDGAVPWMWRLDYGVKWNYCPDWLAYCLRERARDGAFWDKGRGEYERNAEWRKTVPLKVAKLGKAVLSSDGGEALGCYLLFSTRAPKAIWGDLTEENTSHAFAEAFKKYVKNPGGGQNLRQEIWDRGWWLVPPAERDAVMAEDWGAWRANQMPIGEVRRAYAATTNYAQAAEGYLKKIGDKRWECARELDWEMASQMGQQKDYERAKKAMIAQYLRNSGNLDRGNMNWQLENTFRGMSLEARCKLIGEVFTQLGWDGEWEYLVKNRWGTFGEEKVIWPWMKANLKPGQEAADPYRRLWNRLRWASNDDWKKQLEVLAEAVKLYPGDTIVPKEHTYEAMVLDWMFRNVRERNWGRRDAEFANKAFDVFLAKPRLDTAEYQWAVQHFIEMVPDEKVRLELYKRHTDYNVKNDQDPKLKGTEAARPWFMYYPKGTEKLPFDLTAWSEKDYGGLPWFVDRNRWNLTDALRVKLVTDWFVRYLPTLDVNNGDMRSKLCWALDNLATGWFYDNKELREKFPLDALRKKVFAVTLDPNERDAWSYYADLTRRVAYIASRIGKARETLPLIVQQIESAPKDCAALKLSCYMHLMGDCWELGYSTWNRDEKKGALYDDMADVLRDHILPLQRDLLHAAPTWRLGDSRYASRMSNWVSNFADRSKLSAAEQKAYDLSVEEADLFTDAIARGAEIDWHGGSYLLWSSFVKKLNNKDLAGMGRTAKLATSRGGSDRNLSSESHIDILNRVNELEAYEALYLMCGNLRSSWENVQQAAGKLLGTLSGKIPGVYPVSEGDPAYPLYVAADELSRQNPEYALKLLKGNIATFEREVMNLPADFVAWGTDQLRMMRGEKDALLLKARNIATTVISQEQKVTPELVAAMLLVRAETYRDQQNFEAAKLEYETVRNNAAYSKTKSGRKALFRSMDLMIESGNANGAEGQLEYWLSQPDPELQAQAHYFQARIAYDRKDYDECAKQLKEVFQLNFTHTEARFLQGKWKLATGSEVDDTEVMIGNLSDRTAVRPGQQLSISVQDRNLSVAGGGASIPVVVTTEPGGDTEKVFLYPSVRDPTQFKGVIDVKLAKPAISNLTLEVSGKDTVSYTIDSAFLKARGLPEPPPKRMKVVDDAQLELGVSTIRPGNPLTVTVTDRDRSMGGKSDSVAVSIETTSGDILDGFVLKEKKPYAGVFAADVKTALPPPRAFASDTALGSNAGDVINSTKDGHWLSMADGKIGKWIEADTMGSHIATNVTLKMAHPELVTSIRLVGKFAGEEHRLASLPAGNVGSRLGLKYQYWQRAPLRGEKEYRAVMERDDAPKPSAAKALAYEPPRDRSNLCYWRGAFEQPRGQDALVLGVQPKKDRGDALRGLWFALAIDGHTVLTGNGNQLRGNQHLIESGAGCHTLEMFTYSDNRNDAFSVTVADEHGEMMPFPMDWFDAGKHNALSNYVADAAKIVRTNDGFTATMTREMRLRSFRWEFLNVNMPQIDVSAIAVTNWAGEQVLPVTSDFSDSQKNETLEVAPGDIVYVRYSDAFTSGGTKKVIERTARSSFNDATVDFCFELIHGESSRQYVHANRFIPGDRLIVKVEDRDLDTSDEADSLKVTVKTDDGREKVVNLVEQTPHDTENGIHTGVFLGLVKTVPISVTNDTRALPVDEKGTLSVSVEDRENTRPGVPTVRTAKVSATGNGTHALTLYDVVTEREIDTSAKAAVRLKELRRRPGGEGISNIWTDVCYATPMVPERSTVTNPIPVNANAPVPVRVDYASRARHALSELTLEAVTEAELARAAEAGAEPEVVRLPMKIGQGYQNVKLRKGSFGVREAVVRGIFTTTLRLNVGELDAADLMGVDSAGRGPKVLSVNGGDIIRLRVYDGKDLVEERRLSLVSDAKMQMMDATWSGERTAAHVGERFYVQINDPDADVTGDPDHLTATVKSPVSGLSRKIVLTETVPHSGVFRGAVRPTMFLPGETIPVAVTGQVEETTALLNEDRFAVQYGDRLVIDFDDLKAIGGEPKHLSATGTVHKGDSADVNLFSKHFTDADQAVLVQFRLAECLFEQAKEHRRLKQPAKSKAAVARGRQILEEALKNHPESTHAAQGEYLLANLYQELATEAKDAKDKQKATQLYGEAVSRFSTILAVWPESEYAPKAQYHKALCLEFAGDFRRASEEYVKMTYVYPDSELVGDAAMRLATYYYRIAKRYDVSARIYANFQKRFPNHEKAPKALFMCGSCYVKQAQKIAKANEDKKPNERTPTKETYNKAVDAFERLVEVYRTQAAPELRAQALYWAGDTALRAENPRKSYLNLKRCVFEYPETEWARRARGLLLNESEAYDKAGVQE